MTLPQVVLVDGPVRVHFYGVGDPYSDGYAFRDFTADISGNGLNASTMVRTMESGAGLSGFIKQMGEDWKGWEVVRSWRSIEDDLHIHAEHKVMGKILLTFELRNGRNPEQWRASVSLTITAGEELSRLVADVERFCG